jgi:hypothetical protein
MLYLLLIIPHLAAIAGLLAYALLSTPADEAEPSFGGSVGPGGNPAPPSPPSPVPSHGSPQLPRKGPARRRIHDEERRSGREPRRPRRGHPRHQPEPAPKADLEA